MRISKIKIKNLFGITESELDGKDFEITGKNGVGKTSVIDAIKYALTNKSDRDYIVKSGENEGEIIIETDSGLSINRKPRVNQADYKSIRNNGSPVQQPEAFLRDIFTDLQLNPVEFIGWTKDVQNATILDLIQYEWDLHKIKEWFGEIPEGVNYEQNILKVLHEIQKEDGHYFMKRQDINRDIRNKRAFIAEIGDTIPEGYVCQYWEKQNLKDIYTKIEQIRKSNSLVEEAKRVIENKDNKIRKYQADREISIAALDREIGSRTNQISNDIMKLQEQIKRLEAERDSLTESKADKMSVIESLYKASVASFEKEVEIYREFADKPLQPLNDLMEEAKLTEVMKSHINEYKRMLDLSATVDGLVDRSEDLTRKIELARKLPSVILENAVIPVKGLTVKDGIPLINGLPVSNLSEGEKLDLCLDIAVSNPNALQIILIDGTEKLSTSNRKRLYQKCRDKGLQFIATRTTDSAEMIVTEL